MKQLLLATTNKGKIEEIGSFLKDLPVKLVSLTEAGIRQDVEEDRNTYEANSQKKALFYAKISGLPSISDDGGLEIAALGGAPGVKSRRWLGYEAHDEVLIEYMKKVAKELPEDNRSAKFVTVVSFALPSGKVWSGKGEVNGVIAREPYLKFLKGYPYRSFFFLPEAKKFYHESELTPQETKKYNHRWKAIDKIKPFMLKGLRLS